MLHSERRDYSLLYNEPLIQANCKHCSLKVNNLGIALPKNLILTHKYLT